MIHRSNGFDGLRLVAAALVICGHAFPLTGHAPPGILANGVQTIGVKIFFVISGYLITRSWQSDPSLPHFWIKRALRVMPGLVAICLLTILVFGPLLSSLSLRDYFTDGRTFDYLWNIALYPIFFLPGVFADNVYPNAVNGSLWTLPVEVAMYCSVPLLVGRRRPSARLFIAAVALALLAASIYFLHVAPAAQSPVIWGTSIIASLDLAYYFFAGASIALLKLDRFGNVFVGAALFVAASWLFTGSIPGELALAVTLPYLTISIGKIKSALLGRLDGHDYSYGLYLYGFLTQQCVVHFFGVQSPLFNALVSLPIAALLAVMSWHMIERKALAFKPDRKSVKSGARSRPAAA